MPVYKDKKRGTYYVRISTRDAVTGQRREIWKRGFTLRREAVAWEADQLSGDELESRTGITFREMDERYIAYKNPRKESTRTQERIRISRYMSSFADMPIDRITKQILLDWYLELTRREDLAVSTKNYCIGVVRSVFRFASDFYGMENPSTALKKLRTASRTSSCDVWTVEEFRTFLDHVPGEEFRRLFDFMYWTGCRRGEALAIRIEDIDLQERTVRIYHQIKYFEEGFFPLKTDSSERTLRIEPSLWSRLEPFLSESGNGRIFLFGGERSLSITSVARQMTAGIEASGVRRIRLHDLRHCFATNAIASGANIVAVSKYLGHATIQQTLETYTHLLQRSDDELIEIMSRVDSTS